MRILAISDIHANYAALERVLEEAPEFDLIICSGDIVGYGPSPNECIEALRKENIVCVKGNHDHAMISGETIYLNRVAKEAISIQNDVIQEANLKWLRKLPEHSSPLLEEKRTYIVHGSPQQPYREYLHPENIQNKANYLHNLTGSQLIILGHTHIPVIHPTEKGLIINPGSVGQPRDGNPMASYMHIELDETPKVSHGRIEYNIDQVTEKMEKLGFPSSLAIRLIRGW